MEPVLSKNDNLNQETGNGSACLVAKAMNRLVAMGNSRPKTIAKLSATLKSCVAVLPYLNPLDALELANKQLHNTPPHVESQHSTQKVYIPFLSVDESFWAEVRRDLQSGKEQFTFPPSESTEESMYEGVLRWLQSDPEGTKERLREELYRRCRQKHHLEAGSVLERLEKMGFVKVTGDGTVSFLLPSPRDLRVLKEKMQIHTIDICQITSLWSSLGQNNLVRLVAAYQSKYPFLENNSDTFFFGDWRFPVPIDVAEFYSLCLLSEIAPKDRPRNKIDLLRVLEPVCHCTYVISPSSVLTKYEGQIEHRPTLKARRRRSYSTSQLYLQEFAIGVHKKRNVILTPEGLLGVTETSEEELKELSEAGCAKRKCVTGQSREFAEMLIRLVQPLLQQQNAVLILATGEQKSQIIGRVSDWLDSYRDSNTQEGEADNEVSSAGAQTHSQPVPISKVKRQLLSCCILKMTTVPVSFIITQLERHGFISVDYEDPSEPVTYSIPEISRGAIATWQVAASEFWTTSVERCYSKILSKYFPPEDDIQKWKSVGNRVIFSKANKFRPGDVLTVGMHLKRMAGVFCYYVTLPLIGVTIALLISWFGIFR